MIFSLDIPVFPDTLPLSAPAGVGPYKGRVRNEFLYITLKINLLLIFAA